MSSGVFGPPVIRAVPNSMDVDLPHGEWALLFDPDQGFVLGEAAPCVTVTNIGARLGLWSGYHRAYASAAYRTDGDRAILAAVVDDVGLSSRARSCGLRAAKSDNPPILADFFNEALTLPVRFKIKRFTMEIRARVIARVLTGPEAADAADSSTAGDFPPVRA
jgi:hypothetical protein